MNKNSPCTNRRANHQLDILLGAAAAATSDALCCSEYVYRSAEPIKYEVIEAEDALRGAESIHCENQVPQANMSSRLPVTL